MRCWGLWSNIAGVPRNKGNQIDFSPPTAKHHVNALFIEFYTCSSLTPSPKPGLAQGQEGRKTGFAYSPNTVAVCSMLSGQQVWVSKHTSLLLRKEEPVNPQIAPG